MLDPGLVTAVKRRMHFCWVDRKNMIVVRGRKAIRLGAVEFAIFYTIHKYRSHGKLTRQIGSWQLYNEVYSGVASPPALNVFGATIRNINMKLGHLKLKIVGHNHREHSYYELIQI